MYGGVDVFSRNETSTYIVFIDSVDKHGNLIKYISISVFNK